MRVAPTNSSGVAKLQRDLQLLGFSPGPIDGIFGPKTKTALERFEKQHGLRVDGVADAATLAALRTAVAHQKAAAKKARVDLFTKGARAAGKAVLGVEAKIDAAIADGRVSVAEKKSLLAAIEAGKLKARGLVAGQSEPMYEALNHVEKTVKAGHLLTKAANAEARLEDGRKAALKNATFAAEHSPFHPGWAHRYHGIATRDFRYHGLKVHAVAIDLANPHVSLSTNAPRNRGKTLGEYAARTRAEVVINGDFFTFATHKPSGLAVSQGKSWGDPTASFEGYVAFQGKHARVLMPHTHLPEWARNAVSSRPAVLHDGKIIDTDPNKNGRSARTGVGTSKSGRVMYLVAVEGNEARGRGLTGTELGKLLRAMGADDAIAMDSGGSAQLYERGRGMVQRSTDAGGARPVANVIMVQSS